MLDGGPEPGKVGVVPVSRTGLDVWLLEPDRGAERPPPERLPEVLRERLRPFGGPVPAVVASVTAEVDVRSLQSLLLPPPWSRGRTVLVGDAAPTTTPQTAYGVGLAIEDAVVSPRSWRTTCRARCAASAPGGSTVADGWSRPRCSGGSGSDARRQACPCRDGSWVRPGPSSLDPSDGGEPDQHPDPHRCPCGVVRPGPRSSCQPMDVRIPPRVRPAGSISRRAGP